MAKTHQAKLGEDGKQENLMEKLLNELTTWAKTQPEIIALYLYGSQAEARANALSDLDVAILVRPELSKLQL